MAWEAGFMLAHNVGLFVVAIGAGELAVRRSWWPRVCDPAPAVTRLEVVLAAVNVWITSVVALGGWLMWEAGWMRLRPAGAVGVLLDVALLLAVLDFSMGWLHRLAHHPPLYRWVHHLHHRFDHPRPLTVFVLHRLENLAFGALWLAVIVAASPLGGFSLAGRLGT